MTNNDGEDFGDEFYKWTPPTISDGFGNEWSALCPDCKKKTMQVVRPGKVQCSECDGERSKNEP